MNFWWIIPLYFVGVLTMARIIVLWAKEDRQIREDQCTRCAGKPQWCGSCVDRNLDLTLAQYLGVALWPFPAIYLLSKKIIFPHGVVTRYEKQKRAATAQAAREKELKQQEAALRETCDNLGLSWDVFSVGRHGQSERERNNG